MVSHANPIEFHTGSSGKVTFSKIEPGDYILRVVARNDKDDRAAVSRRIFVSNGSHCAVHLINSGLTIYGDNAKVEFATTGLPISGITCTVDSQHFPCTYTDTVWHDWWIS